LAQGNAPACVDFPLECSSGLQRAPYTMNRAFLAFLFVGLVAGHFSHVPHHHDHDGDEDHDEDHHHAGHSESNLRPVCPFLAMLVPKLEGVQEEMDQIVRAANASFMKSPHDKQPGDEQQASDYDLLMEKMANAMETSVVGVYPDLENNKAVTVFDIFYEQGAELLRSRWAIEVDQATGRWGLWQQGSLKTGEADIQSATGKESTAVVSKVHEVIHALKEVGHSHECKTLGKQLSYAAELDVMNADEFDFSNFHMGKRHGRHHHDDDDESSDADDRPMYDRLVGRDAIQQVCEQWAARQQRHITMQFVHPEEMFVRPVFGKKASYDVLVTGSVEMKTVFADKVVHWPGAVRMVLNTGNSHVSQLKVYTLEATSLEAKWGWKYGSGGMAGWMKAMLAIGSFAAVLVIFCCLCACVVSAACSTMWSNYFFTRCRSRRVVRALPHGPVAAAQPPQQATARSDMAVPLRSAPLVPAPPTTVTPQ